MSFTIRATSLLLVLVAAVMISTHPTVGAPYNRHKRGVYYDGRNNVQENEVFPVSIKDKKILLLALQNLIEELPVKLRNSEDRLRYKRIHLYIQERGGEEKFKHDMKISLKALSPCVQQISSPADTVFIPNMGKLIHGPH